MIDLHRLLMAVVILIAFGSMTEAKCFKFSNKGGDVGVCVPGDSTDSRKIAKRICDDKEGNCGSVSSSMSRCHSNTGKCYDENGNASRDLSR